MNRILSTTILASLLCFQGCSNDLAAPQALEVMTFNIRLDLASDGPNAWPHRKELATSMIRYHEPHLFGVQEALKGQIQDLSQRFPQYDSYGLGRDDGMEGGEHMSVFYLRERFAVLDKGTFWLSETPEQPGKGWDAAWIRTTTWMKLKDQFTDRSFFVFNTHFDNRGEQARLNSAHLVLERMTQVAGDAPTLFMGDLNCMPASEPYKVLTQTPSRLRDSRLISESPHHGPSRTSNWFQIDALKDSTGPIDHILVTPEFRVLKHATLSDSFDGRFPSDHFPVMARVMLR